MFLKEPLIILYYMHYYTSKQSDIIDSQGCYNLMEAHRVEMNNKDGFIMH